MERHRCKICCRKFANGRALGGHMRSHMMNLPIVPKPSNETESWAELSPVLPSPSSSSSSSSSDDDDDDDKDEEELGETEKGLAYKLRENPRKSTKFTDHNNNAEFSSFGSSSVSVTEDLDREETDEFESESSKQHNNPTKKRSKRRRQRNQKQPPIETTPSLSPSPESSVSEVTSEEDVALCLMMLSRDNWKCSAAKKDDRFTCLTCHKVFRSYQALGGHRASHKKIRPENHPQPGSGSGSDPSKQRKTHECPVCFRVFASAQALGGHKRTHSSTTSAAAGCGGTDGVHGGASESNGFGESPRKKMNAFIDLNLPAPVDDHDDEISQVSLSAVSDPHFS